jgi:hypothetical protein
MYWHIWDLWGSRKLSSSTVTELDNNLPRFTDDRRESVRATHRLPIEVFTWKTALGRGRTQPDTLIVITIGGHSCCLHGSHVSCFQVISHARWLLIQISVTHLNMGELCSLRPNVEDENNIMIVMRILGWHSLLCIHGMMLYHLLHELPLHA